MVAAVHLEAFRVAVERRDNPSLMDTPVAIVSAGNSSLVLEASAEAQAAGIKAGMKWEDALQRSRDCRHVAANPVLYREASARVMGALREISPDTEQLSADEAFLDLTHHQSYFRNDPGIIGKLIIGKVQEASGLSCTVGISGDKTTARWAARRQGANGWIAIPPDQAEQALQDERLADLFGLGPDVEAFFARYGITCCGDMRKIPVSVPAHHLGTYGRRLWMMALGQDPSPVQARGPVGGELSQGKVLTPGTNDATVLMGHCLAMAEKLAARLLRMDHGRYDLQVGILCPEGWRQVILPRHDNCNADGIVQSCRRFLSRHWFGEVVRHIRLQAIPAPATTWQHDFFAPDIASPPRTR